MTNFELRGRKGWKLHQMDLNSLGKIKVENTNNKGEDMVWQLDDLEDEVHEEDDLVEDRAL